ncbi:hypothetical protein M707_22840 [Arthrobacter sp. AK-YN10]|nr:hypothetical protein M707_22840 [Arthrobacter sp. AK-YN10]
MFNSHPDYFNRNIQDGKGLSAIPARLAAPDGQEVPGIAVFNGKHLKFCITEADAIRLATDIADTIQTKN